MAEIESRLEYVEYNWPDAEAMKRLEAEVAKVIAEDAGWWTVGVIVSTKSRRMYALFEREKEEKKS